MTVNEAVRELRKHSGKTQQIFATELGISISSLNNYERHRTPEPKQLITFERAAQRAGREDLAEVFRMKAQGALGVEYALMIPSSWCSNSHDRGPDDWYEVAAREALANCLRMGTKCQDIAPSVVSAIALAVGRLEEIKPRYYRGLSERFAAESIRRGYIPSAGSTMPGKKIQKSQRSLKPSIKIGKEESERNDN